jgi:hypothetical protein
LLELTAPDRDYFGACVKQKLHTQQLAYGLLTGLRGRLLPEMPSIEAPEKSGKAVLSGTILKRLLGASLMNGIGKPSTSRAHSQSIPDYRK